MRTKTPRSVASAIAFFTVLSGAFPSAFTEEKKISGHGLGPRRTHHSERRRRAYNEGKFDVAAERFREFLKQNSSKQEAPAAHYGLALALLDLPQKDYTSANAELKLAVAAQFDPHDRPFALYHLGYTQRKLALQALEQAIGKPKDAAAAF